ncbi:hypothetical protein ACFOY2_05165 [Nonomuraea purpurea]|uniref:Ead/Ea22-like family protein n=1 Tax=Nonomuraea purpurea TaxID=1849276 RepID=A0ABV8G0S7_9ACTN
MSDDLRQRYAEALAATNTLDATDLEYTLGLLLTARDDELAELREQVAFQKHRADTYQADLEFLERQHKFAINEREAWRERAETAEEAVKDLESLISDERAIHEETIQRAKKAAAAVARVLEILDERRHSYPSMDHSVTYVDPLLPGGVIRGALADLGFPETGRG